MSEQPTWEEYISEFLVADEQQQEGLWRQAEIALAIRDRFGGDQRHSRWEALKRFAGEIGRSTNTLWQYARTAEFFPDFTRVKHLSFTHHKICAVHCPAADEAQVAIYKAADEMWSTRDLQEFLVEAYSFKVEGVLEVYEPGRISIGGECVGGALARWDGQRVEIRARVKAEEE